MTTLEDVIKEVQGHGMLRVFKKNGEPTKDGWRYYDRLIHILFMVKHLIDGDNDTFDNIISRIEEIMLYEYTTKSARKKIEEHLYG